MTVGLPAPADRTPHTVAARIRELLDAGTPASQVAVLFRTNGQS